MDFLNIKNAVNFVGVPPGTPENHITFEIHSETSRENPKNLNFKQNMISGIGFFGRMLKRIAGLYLTILGLLAVGIGYLMLKKGQDLRNYSIVITHLNGSESDLNSVLKNFQRQNLMN